MILKHLQSLLLQKLQQKESSPDTDLHFFSVGGGSINETYRLVWKDKQFFCKINSATRFPDLFRKEKKGLDLIARQGNIKTPGIMDEFETGNYQVLLLKWVESGERTDDFWKKFGEQLAALHSNRADSFGLDEDNYMGSVQQVNTIQKDWSRFFIENRLQPLVDLCYSKKLLSDDHLARFNSFYTLVAEIFNDDQKPVLVHGDLWNGNFMCDEHFDPVLIDPAVYYGHPAVDLGMTTLFGGFPPGFYESYNYHLQFPKNHKQQWQACNLYPLLIHLFLFGKSYLPQIEFSLKTIS